MGRVRGLCRLAGKRVMIEYSRIRHEAHEDHEEFIFGCHRSHGPPWERI